jgi:integrase
MNLIWSSSRTTLIGWLKAMGLLHARVPDMRHTYASSQLLAYTPMLEVSRALGHASIAHTLGVYTHIQPEVQDNASAAAGPILGEVTRLSETMSVTQ